MLFIYDIDHTLICSKHRQLTDENGKLDLDHWRANSTQEKILKDKLLPFGADVARYLSGMPEGLHVACTARVMQTADFELLIRHGLIFDYILSRPADCTLADVELKKMLLRDFAFDRNIPFKRLIRTAIFWDDNDAIRAEFARLGATCYNPIPYNETRRIMA